jgi:uncharacterized protein involved in exopolysaccharide biosynthesis
VGQTPAVDIHPSDRRAIVLANAAILRSHDLARATIKAFGIATVYPDIVARPPARGTPMDAAVKRFLNNLWVNVGPQDNVITVSLLHPDRHLAPRLVAELISLYIKRQTDFYHDPHRTFLAAQVAKARNEVDSAQAELERFKGHWHISDYHQQVRNLLGERDAAESALHTAQSDLDQTNVRSRQLRLAMRRIPKTLPESANSEKYRALDDAQASLDRLRTKQSQMLATYRADGPAMAALNAGIATAEAEVRARRAELRTRSTTTPNVVYQTLQTDYLRSRAAADSDTQPIHILKAQLASVDQRLTVLRNHQGAYSDLLRKNRIADETYHTLAIQYANARVKSRLNQDRISPAVVISSPTTPYRTARPRTLIVVLASLVGGTILATAGILLREAADDRLATAEQVAFLLDVPVLASFPHQPDRIPLHYLGFGDTQ